MPIEEDGCIRVTRVEIILPYLRQAIAFFSFTFTYIERIWIKVRFGLWTRKFYEKIFDVNIGKRLYVYVLRTVHVT